MQYVRRFLNSLTDNGHMVQQSQIETNVCLFFYFYVVVQFDYEPNKRKQYDDMRCFDTQQELMTVK